jgi:hypothetical protein
LAFRLLGRSGSFVSFLGCWERRIGLVGERIEGASVGEKGWEWRTGFVVLEDFTLVLFVFRIFGDEAWRSGYFGDLSSSMSVFNFLITSGDSGSLVWKVAVVSRRDHSRLIYSW